MRRMLVACIIFVCTLLVANSVLLGVRIYRGVQMAEGTKPFGARPDRAQYRVLVAGDASGVGVGAGAPSLSVAGRIARDFPLAHIDNVSRRGSAARDILKQVRSAGRERYDLVIIEAGGVDILRFDRKARIEALYAEALRQASRISPHVVFMGPLNLGEAPAMFPPLTWIYSRRSLEIRDAFIHLCRENGTEYIDLCTSPGEESLLPAHGRYFAADKLHLSGEGYGLYYRELMSRTSVPYLLRGK